MSDVGFWNKLPVGDYPDAMRHLRRPFAVEAVKWKVQAGTLVVPYIDKRLVIERLNHVVPGDWYEGDKHDNPAFEPIAGGKGLLCRLTVIDVTHCDVGSGYEGKGLYSDAFKRAAVPHGVGVSLYALKKLSLDPSGDFLRLRGTTKAGKPIYALTDAGEEYLRDSYGKWLERKGEDAFGPALDHGDVFGAMGDVEAEVEAPATDAPPEQAEKLTDAKAKSLIAGAEKLYADLPKETKGAKGLTQAAFKRSLESASHSHGDLEKLCADLEKRANA